MIGRDDVPSPWTRLSRELVYENGWIQVFHDEVRRPDGSPGVYGVVHPRTHAVGVVAMDERDRVLLVGQYRYTLGRYSWEIPEGGVARGNDLLAGAQRELAEETGFSAQHWTELLRFSLSNSTTDETGALYLATGLVAGEAHPDETEELAVRWLAFDQALAQVRSGELFDCMTQMGIMRVALDRPSEP
ncbi:MAG TPA: NUDIX hydrolase [Actinomycetota bacterium]|nr:NUDIX hydrolase [Actinomycetota bacterium]